jgi:hypothetical protein
MAAVADGQDEKRQCLELFNSYGFSILNVWEGLTSAIERLAPMEKKAHISLAPYIVQVLKTVLPSSDHEGADKKPDVAADLVGLCRCHAWRMGRNALLSIILCA